MIAGFPAEWTVMPLGRLARVYSGGTPLRSVASYWNGPIPWVTTAEIDFGVITAARQGITRAGLRASAAKIAPPGTVLIAMYGQGKTRGKSAVLGIPAAMNQACAAVEVYPGLSSRYLAQYLASEYDAIRSLSNSGGQENLSGEIVKRIPIVVPTPSEQERIADALENADAVISTLSRLLRKRDAMRHGMMQQLMTGRTRLPGFYKPWRTARLRDAGATFGGLSGKIKDDFGQGSASFVTFMEVMEGARLRGHRLEPVRVRRTEHQNRVQRDDVLFNGSSETPEEVALSAVVDFDPAPTTYLNSFCFGYRLQNRELLDPTYLAYFFRSEGGRALVSSLAQGATRYNIAKTKFMELSPSVPPMDEQRAVVHVLVDAEDEITSLKQRVAKAQGMKRGMMQELLTGRTRLQTGAMAV